MPDSRGCRPGRPRTGDRQSGAGGRGLRVPARPLVRMACGYLPEGPGTGAGVGSGGRSPACSELTGGGAVNSALVSAGGGGAASADDRPPGPAEGGAGSITFVPLGVG